METAFVSICLVKIQMPVQMETWEGQLETGPGEVLHNLVFNALARRLLRLIITRNKKHSRDKFCGVWIWYLLLERLFEYEKEEVSC